MNINQIMLGDEIEFDGVYKRRGAQDQYTVHYHGVVIGLENWNGSLSQVELARGGSSNPLDMRFTVVKNFRLIHRMVGQDRSNSTPGSQ